MVITVERHPQHLRHRSGGQPRHLWLPYGKPVIFGANLWSSTLLTLGFILWIFLSHPTLVLSLSGTEFQNLNGIHNETLGYFRARRLSLQKLSNWKASSMKAYGNVLALLSPFLLFQQLSVFLERAQKLATQQSSTADRCFASTVNFKGDKSTGDNLHLPTSRLTGVLGTELSKGLIVTTSVEKNWKRQEKEVHSLRAAKEDCHIKTLYSRVIFSGT